MRRVPIALVLAVVATLAALTMVRAVTPAQCGTDYLNTCQHWARPASGEVVVGVKYVNIDPALVASVLAEWSRSPQIEMRLVGPGAYASCLWTDQFERGVVTVCGDGSYGECCPMGWIGSFTSTDYPVGNHINGASVHVVSYYGPEKQRHSLCHELGHALGLNHPSAPDPGCMGGGNTINGDTLPWQCPSARDFTLLADLYGHIDGYATAAPAAGTIGAYYCGPAPSPTPTASPTPTVTATAAPSPTPIVTPSPSPTMTATPRACSPGRKCRYG